MTSAARPVTRHKPLPEIFELARALARQLAHEDYERARVRDSARRAVQPESATETP